MLCLKVGCIVVRYGCVWTVRVKRDMGNWECGYRACMEWVTERVSRICMVPFLLSFFFEFVECGGGEIE